MDDTERLTSITEVGRVIVPVADQDRALEFYAGVLGFETRTDSGPGGDMRWLEVAPPQARTTIALVPPRGGMWGAPGIDTHISLTTTDIDADHAKLLGRGVDTDDEVLRLGDFVPPMFFFRDPDGNILQVVQAD